MDTGPHSSKGWIDNLNDTVHLPSGRSPDSLPVSRISILPASALGRPSAASKNLPPLSCVLQESPPSLPLVGSSPSFTVASDGLQRSATGRSFPFEPSLKRPRLSYDHGSGSESEAAISIAKDRISKPDAHQKSFSVFSRPAADGRCAECALITPMIRNVISRVRDLESEFRRVSTVSRHKYLAEEENEGLLTSVNVGLSDLEKQLTWAAAVIERSTTLIGDLAGANREQPPIWSTVSASTSLLPQDLSTVIKSAPPELPKRRSVDEEHDRNDFRRKLSVQMHRDTQLGEQFFTIPGNGTNAPFSSLACHQPITQPQREFMASHAPPSRLQSPLQGSLPSLIHPSLSSIRFQPTTGQQQQQAMSPSLDVSVYTSHLQDLQHQISTKSLALQTLQREHDNLLAAFSRQQTRCLTLDKKTKVADDEIKTLTEDKTRLLNQVEALEAQVDELVKSKEEAHQQSVASGAQYMQIVAMSSRLQAQSVADLRRWKAEKEEWEKQRESFIRRIQDLESIGRACSVADSQQPAIQNASLSESSRTLSSSLAQASSLNINNVPTSKSPDVLRMEVMRLRASCRDMEAALKDLSDEAGRFDNALGEAKQISHRIRSRAQAALQSQPQPEASPAVDQEQDKLSCERQTAG